MPTSIASLGFGWGRKTHMPKHTPSPLSQSHSPYPQSAPVAAHTGEILDPDDGFAVYPDEAERVFKQQGSGGGRDTARRNGVTDQVKVSEQSVSRSALQGYSGDLWDWSPQLEQEQQDFSFKSSPQAITAKGAVVGPDDRQMAAVPTPDTRDHLQYSYPEESEIVIKQERFGQASPHSLESARANTHALLRPAPKAFAGEDSRYYSTKSRPSRPAGLISSNYPAKVHSQNPQVRPVPASFFAEGYTQDYPVTHSSRSDLDRQPAPFPSNVSTVSISNRTDSDVVGFRGESMEALRSIPKTTPNIDRTQSHNRTRFGALKPRPFAQSQRYGHEDEMAHPDQWIPNQPEIRNVQDPVYERSSHSAGKPSGFYDKIFTPEAEEITETKRFLVPEVFGDASNVLNGLDINGLWRKARDRALSRSATADFPAFEGLFGNRGAAFSRISKYHNDVILGAVDTASNDPFADGPDFTALKDIKDASLAEKKAKTDLYGEAGEQMAEQLADIQTMTRQISSKRRRPGTSVSRAE